MIDNPEGVEVEDPEDYTTSQRLKQIYDARRQLREMRRQASQFRHSGAGVRAQMRAVQHYRSGLESYLLEVDTLLREHEPGKTMWANKHYGTITVQPPGDFQKKRGYYQSTNLEIGPNQALKVKSIPDPKEVDIVGLKWLFETDSPIQRSFEFNLQSHTLGGTHTATASSCVSWTTLNKMVSDVNSFLGELGIGLNIDDTDEWNI